MTFSSLGLDWPADTIWTIERTPEQALGEWESINRRIRHCYEQMATGSGCASPSSSPEHMTLYRLRQRQHDLSNFISLHSSKEKLVAKARPPLVKPGYFRQALPLDGSDWREEPDRLNITAGAFVFFHDSCDKTWSHRVIRGIQQIADYRFSSVLHGALLHSIDLKEKSITVIEMSGSGTCKLSPYSFEELRASYTRIEVFTSEDQEASHSLLENTVTCLSNEEEDGDLYSYPQILQCAYHTVSWGTHAKRRCAAAAADIFLEEPLRVEGKSKRRRLICSSFMLLLFQGNALLRALNSTDLRLLFQIKEGDAPDLEKKKGCQAYLTSILEDRESLAAQFFEGHPLAVDAKRVAAATCRKLAGALPLPGKTKELKPGDK